VKVVKGGKSSCSSGGKLKVTIRDQWKKKREEKDRQDTLPQKGDDARGIEIVINLQATSSNTSGRFKKKRKSFKHKNGE